MTGTSTYKAVNGFAVLRLLAALAVVLDHSFLFTGRLEPVVAKWHDRELDLGALAVLTFFGLSGYLITQSWCREPDLVRFVHKRVLRIWPALVALVALTVFVFGPLTSTHSAGRYFADPLTWEYLRTVTLVPVHMHLPGMFESNPETAVNPSLWTLPIEVTCYGILGILGVVGGLRRGALFICLLMLYAVDLVVQPGHQSDLCVLLMAFLWGAVLSRSPEVSRGVTGLAVLVIAMTLVTSAGSGLAVLAWVHLVIRAGCLPMRRLQWLVDRGDPSYGIYIYGAPLQQAFVLLGLTTPWPVFAASLLVIPAVGYASWHLVEKRALRLLRRRPGPLQAPVPAVLSAPAGARAS